MSEHLIRLTAAELGERSPRARSRASRRPRPTSTASRPSTATSTRSCTSSEHALETAADIDRRRAAGEALGPLAGVPLAIKDVLVTTDMPSTSGSRILEG